MRHPFWQILRTLKPASPRHESPSETRMLLLGTVVFDELGTPQAPFLGIPNFMSPQTEGFSSKTSAATMSFTNTNAQPAIVHPSRETVNSRNRMETVIRWRSTPCSLSVMKKLTITAHPIASSANVCARHGSSSTVKTRSIVASVSPKRIQMTASHGCSRLVPCKGGK
jgi:hypothetical protein